MDPSMDPLVSAKDTGPLMDSPDPALDTALPMDHLVSARDMDLPMGSLDPTSDTDLPTDPLSRVMVLPTVLPATDMLPLTFRQAPATVIAVLPSPIAALLSLTAALLSLTAVLLSPITVPPSPITAPAMAIVPASAASHYCHQTRMAWDKEPA